MRGKGKGKVMGHSQPQPGACSGRRTLRSCRSKKDAENVVLIDVDGDSFRNVILIDIPESLGKKIQAPESHVPRKNGRYPLHNVIYIDDDETAEEHCNGKGVNGKENLAGASSGMRCATSYENSDGDDCQFVQENISPVTISKCKRTYSGKVSSRNIYGLSSDIEIDDSSDNDFDCEFMGSSFEQWEEAAMKRKNGVRNGYEDVGRGSKFDKHAKETLFEDLRKHPQKSKLERKNNFSTENQASTSKIFCDDIHETERRSQSREFNFNRKDVPPKDKPKNAEQGPVLSTSEVNEEASFENTKQSNGTVRDIFKENLTPKYSSRESEVEIGKNLHEESATKDPSLCKDGLGDGADNIFYAENGNHQTVYGEESSFINEREKLTETNPYERAFEEEWAYKQRGLQIQAEETQKSRRMRKMRDDDETSSSVENSYINEREKIKETDLYKRAVEEEWASRQKELQIQAEEAQQLKQMCKKIDNDITNEIVENSLINEREKIKETDDYKRAVEEEWASRQRELQIQAEEAQNMKRMLKRRKAETMRILDVEKRQKQRVEEMRETQKKDEENMNLKERLRAEVRKELQMLELLCRDMASLLRGLGIVVNGGLNPSPQEVRVAYKKALLNFHPDRASQSEIRQQVEAEEKFKLISRMKDKFLPNL
jgi:hypothetical protein